MTDLGADYREVLIKYIMAVGEAEGVYFDPDVGQFGFTEEEKATWEECAAEADKRYNATPR